jgi:hypothetical protein
MGDRKAAQFWTTLPASVITRRRLIMDTKSLETINPSVDGKLSLDDELADLIQRSSKDMPELVEQIKDYQQYCSTIKAFVAEVSVKEDWTNG